MEIHIDKNHLIDELGLPYDAEDGVILRDRIIDTDRWSTIHELVFLDGNTMYMCSYSVGSTEMQDEDPWEYNNMVRCLEVEPVEVLEIKYLPVDRKK